MLLVTCKEYHVWHELFARLRFVSIFFLLIRNEFIDSTLIFFVEITDALHYKLS